MDAFAVQRNRLDIGSLQVYRDVLNDWFWPTGDGLHPLNAHPKPDAQGAAAKVSFAALSSPVARPALRPEADGGCEKKRTLNV